VGPGRARQQRADRHRARSPGSRRGTGGSQRATVLVEAARGHSRPRPHWPGGLRQALAVSRRCDRRCKSSLGCEPLQDMVVAVPLQQSAGRNQMPGQRPVVPGLQECATEFLARSWPGQVRPEGAEQDKVGGGERLRGQPDERIRSSTWISSPSLAQQTHGLPLKPSPRPPLDCPRSGVRATSVWHRRMSEPIPAGPASWTHSSSAQRYGRATLGAGPAGSSRS
jgi:hypothetical protein